MSNAFAAITAPGGAELVIILVLAVLLFGAKKLPDLGGAVGKSIRNFKKGIGEAKDDEGDAASSSTDSEAIESEAIERKSSTPDA